MTLQGPYLSTDFLNHWDDGWQPLHCLDLHCLSDLLSFFPSPHSAAVVFLMFSHHCRHVPTSASLPVRLSVWYAQSSDMYMAFFFLFLRKLFSNGVKVRPSLAIFSKTATHVPNHLWPQSLHPYFSPEHSLLYKSDIIYMSVLFALFIACCI